MTTKPARDVQPGDVISTKHGPRPIITRRWINTNPDAPIVVLRLHPMHGRPSSMWATPDHPVQLATDFPLQEQAERILKELTGPDFQTVHSILESAGIIPEST